MTALQFDVDELAFEVEFMKRAAASLLEPDAGAILDNVKNQIEVLRHSNQSITIQVGTNWPIRTIACGGGYERKNGGARKDLYGELVFKWELNPLGTASNKPHAKRRVEVAGIASSVARLKVDWQGHKYAIASWRMEVGDANSPGAFFHAQIPDTLSTSPQSQGNMRPHMWPPDLPVPRLPIPPITPMLALEFVIAEIFRDTWSERLASGVFKVGQWRDLQQRRYMRYFDWQADVVKKSGQGSPILSIRDAKPDSGLLLSSF